MQTKLEFRLTVSIIGDDAQATARTLAQAVDAGRLDLPLLAMMREELRNVDGDWRISTVTSSATVASNDDAQAVTS